MKIPEATDDNAAMTTKQADVTLKLLGQKPHENQLWPLAGKTTYKLGRAPGNDVTLPFSWVSRQHAMIQAEENNLHYIIDLGSANGTSVNSKRIYTPTRLFSGDTITIGKSSLIFQQHSSFHTSGNDLETDAGEQTVAFLHKEMVSVLVCDIRGYTRLSERIGDSQISTLLSFWTRKVSDVVLKNDGRVDKFIGDAVMAVWTESNDFSKVSKALLTALEISRLTRLIGQKIPAVNQELQIWAALNTGEAVMGNIGVDGQRDFTIIGDVVNIVYRLEEMASTVQQDFLMGAATYSHLPDAERFFSPHLLKMKGKAQDFLSYGCNFNQLQQYLFGLKIIPDN